MKKMREEVSNLLCRTICRRKGEEWEGPAGCPAQQRAAQWPELCDTCSNSQGQDTQAGCPQSSLVQFSHSVLKKTPITFNGNFREPRICS